MKCGKIRSLRGSFITEGGAFKIPLIIDDGRNNEGLKVLSLDLFSSTGEPTAGIDATLSMGVIPSGLNIFDASDNRQIAWATGGYDNGLNIANMRTVIDPNHVVNRDLYLYGECTAGVVWSYLILVEAIHLTDDEAIIAIIKEDSQS